jgi:hypothetical protein
MRGIVTGRKQIVLFHGLVYTLQGNAHGIGTLSKAIDHLNLGMLYQVQGQFEEAERLLKRVLAIREQQLGAAHLDTATSLNNLGALYQGCPRGDHPTSSGSTTLASSSGRAGTL